MSDEEALYRTIVESPQDDAPRLVYADWLEDHGRDTQARFIRLSIDYDRNQFPPQEINQIGREIWELWSHHAIDWNWRLPKRDGFIWGSRPRRGFVNKVQFYSFQSLQKHGTAILNATPIEVLHIDLYRKEYTALADLPLGRISQFHIHYSQTNNDFIRDLLAIPHQQPWNLILNPNEVNVHDISKILYSAHSPTLMSIDFHLGGQDKEVIVREFGTRPTGHAIHVNYEPNTDILRFAFKGSQEK